MKFRTNRSQVYLIKTSEKINKIKVVFIFFYLILNKILMLNSIKYYVVYFFNIFFLLNIKK